MDKKQLISTAALLLCSVLILGSEKIAFADDGVSPENGVFSTLVALKLQETGLFRVPLSHPKTIRNSRFSLDRLDAIFTSLDLKKTVFLKVEQNSAVSQPAGLQSFLGGYFFQGSTGEETTFSIFLRGFSREEARQAVSLVSSTSSPKKQGVLLQAFSRAIDFLSIPVAHADCGTSLDRFIAVPAGWIDSGNQIANQFLDRQNPVVGSVGGCALGAINFVVDTIEFFVGAGVIAVDLVTDFHDTAPKIMKAASQVWSSGVYLVTHLQSEISKYYNNFSNLSPQKKAQKICKALLLALTIWKAAAMALRSGGSILKSVSSAAGRQASQQVERQVAEDVAAMTLAEILKTAAQQVVEQIQEAGRRVQSLAKGAADTGDHVDKLNAIRDLFDGSDQNTNGSSNTT